jgi:pyruvate-formate lyase-activating enzyme
MKDYTKIISEYIAIGTPIIVYTVGGDTFSVLRQLKHQYNVLPTAICDNDHRKQGRAYSGLFGLPVLSAEEAIATYPDALYFISSIDYRFQIMGELTSKGTVSSSKIINYEPIEKRKSCAFLERSIVIYDNGKTGFCCIQKSPGTEFIPEYIQTYNKLTEKFKTLKKQQIDALKISKGVNEVCAQCKIVCEEWYPTETKSWWVNYFGRNVCNFKCAYCCSSTQLLKDVDDVPLLSEVIDTYREIGMLSDFYSVVLSTSGEPTLHPKRKELFEHFDGYALVVNTNGSVFDDDLFALMQEKMVRIVVSIDSGTPETFEKIKGLNVFEKVVDNLKRYQSAAVGFVVPKYIVTLGINDNEADADGFISLVKELGSPYIIIAYDQYGERPIPENAVKIIRRIKNGVEEIGVLCVIYAAYETYEYVATLKAAFED